MLRHPHQPYLETYDSFVSSHATQLRDTQMRLKEAVEDLERDEAIFAEKMKDMKALRKLTKRLAKENESLKQSHRRACSLAARVIYSPAVGRSTDLSACREPLD